MPLVVISGFPSSGKSTLANRLREYFTKEKSINTFVVSENDCKYKRNEVFSDVQKEKEVRADVKSDVQRLLNKNDVIILDSGNYIKGYRYELYCLAKSSKTTHCVLHCDVNAETAWSWNCDKAREDAFDRRIFDELIQRYEEPDSRNRWDSPLFTLQAREEVPLAEIHALLYEKKALRPNKSTQQVPIASTNFVYELDHRTQEIVNVLLEAQKNSMLGDDVAVPGVTDSFRYTRNVSVGELARLRRQFITYSKMRPVDDPALISSMFVQYLNTGIQ